MSGQLQQWKLMPNSIKKVAKVGSKILPITKKPLKLPFLFFVKAGIFLYFWSHWQTTFHTISRQFITKADSSFLILMSYCWGKKVLLYWSLTALHGVVGLRDDLSAGRDLRGREVLGQLINLNAKKPCSNLVKFIGILMAHCRSSFVLFCPLNNRKVMF